MQLINVLSFLVNVRTNLILCRHVRIWRFFSLYIRLYSLQIVYYMIVTTYSNVTHICNIISFTHTMSTNWRYLILYQWSMMISFLIIHTSHKATQSHTYIHTHTIQQAQQIHICNKHSYTSIPTSKTHTTQMHTHITCT